MLPPIYTMNNNPVHVKKAGAVRQDMGCCGIQSSVPMLPDYGVGQDRSTFQLKIPTGQNSSFNFTTQTGKLTFGKVIIMGLATYVTFKLGQKITGK